MTLKQLDAKLQAQALEVANRIVIFSRGNLEQVGTPREVYEQPSNEFVARFIGVMNILEPEVQDFPDCAGAALIDVEVRLGDRHTQMIAGWQ